MCYTSYSWNKIHFTSFLFFKLHTRLPFKVSQCIKTRISSRWLANKHVTTIVATSFYLLKIGLTKSMYLKFVYMPAISFLSTSTFSQVSFNGCRYCLNNILPWVLVVSGELTRWNSSLWAISSFAAILS